MPFDLETIFNWPLGKDDKLVVKPFSSSMFWKQYLRCALLVHAYFSHIDPVEGIN